MTTWEFKDLTNLPVISNTAAREIGRVHEVLFNPAANALFGLVVTPAEKDGPRLLIPQRGIRTIGKDAITVESLNVAEHYENNQMAQEISAAGGHRTGINVMTRLMGLILAALAVVAIAQTPSRPVWPIHFSASVLVRDNRERMPQFFRWFYDFALNKDRFDGMHFWQGEPYLAERIFDHSKNTQYTVYYQQDFETCFYHPINGTVPRPDFGQDWRFLGKATIDYTTVNHWFFSNTNVTMQFYDAADDNRRPVRFDLDDRAHRFVASWSFHELDIQRQDPALFTLPNSILANCNKA